jgi:hypothetical protein
MNVAPPKLTRGHPPVSVIVFSAVALVIVATVFFFNPSTHHFYPVCLFHKITGLNCPGCGMTRSLFALLHLKFFTAVRDNALFVTGIFLLGIRGGWLVINKFRRQPVGEFFRVQWLWPVLLVTLVFTVLRNLPAFSFLSPE